MVRRQSTRGIVARFNTTPEPISLVPERPNCPVAGEWDDCWQGWRPTGSGARAVNERKTQSRGLAWTLGTPERRLPDEECRYNGQRGTALRS